MMGNPGEKIPGDRNHGALVPWIPKALIRRLDDTPDHGRPTPDHALGAVLLILYPRKLDIAEINKTRGLRTAPTGTAPVLTTISQGPSQQQYQHRSANQ